MATYNGQEFIEEQLDSILAQLTNYDEIIISDNGSTDLTCKIIESKCDSRIKLFYHKPTSSFSKSHYFISDNFHNSLNFASGDIIFLADQDDIWEKNKVEIMLDYFDKYDLVISNYTIIDANYKRVKLNEFSINEFNKSIFCHCLFPKYHGCTLAFKSNMLRLILPFPRKLILHDSWIGILISYFGEQIILDDKYLVKYRRHSNNASFFDKKSSNSLFFKISYRIQLFFQIYFRILHFKISKK